MATLLSCFLFTKEYYTLIFKILQRIRFIIKAKIYIVNILYIVNIYMFYMVDKFGDNDYSSS